MKYDATLVGYAVNSTSGGYTNTDVKYLDTVAIKYLYSHFYGTYCAEPVAFLQLAAEMRNQGINTHILDGLLLGYTRDELEQKLLEIDCNIFCFSLYESSKNDVLYLMKFIKERRKDAIIITGGPYVTLCYEELIETEPVIDYIVIGDGDVAMPKLINGILQSKDISNIANVVYRNTNGKAYLSTEPKAIDMNTIQPLERDFYDEIEKKGFSLSICSSRGCGHANCSFCYLKQFQKNGHQPKYRYRDPRLVVEEIKTLVKKYNIKKLTFVDDDFFGTNTEGINRAKKIFELLINENIHLDLYVNARVASVIFLIKNDLLSLCVKAGIKYFFIGIESYNDNILEKYKKGITTKDIDIICDKLDEYGILINPGLITFDYSITIEQVKNNVQLLKRIRYYDAFMFTRTLMLIPDDKQKMRDNRIKTGDFLHSDTELLYNTLVKFRDLIYELFFYVKKEKMNSDIRDYVVSQHFDFFEMVYNSIKSNSKEQIEGLIDKYYYNIKECISRAF